MVMPGKMRSAELLQMKYAHLKQINTSQDSGRIVHISTGEEGVLFMYKTSQHHLRKPN
jgi:hypothetical protein